MTGQAPPRVAVIAPVFNDWACAHELLLRLSKIGPEVGGIVVYLVDDGSTDADSFSHTTGWNGLERVAVIRAGANLGHQRAIAIGLATALSEASPEVVVVIDADGEDDPTQIPGLLQHLSHEFPVVVAQRRGRTENLRFRTFYRFYKVAFRVLTGRTLDFGNFSVLTNSAADRLTYMPELWNHFPAAVMRSRLPLLRIPTDRHARFQGETKMNFVSLVNHGLAAIATFNDVVFARLLTLVSMLAGVFVAAGVAVAGVRLLSQTAVPGWATAAMGFVILALFQLLALLAVMTFIQLASRSNIPLTPRLAAPAYVRDIRRFEP